jgi:hypothetical protein
VWAYLPGQTGAGRRKLCGGLVQSFSRQQGPGALVQLRAGEVSPGQVAHGFPAVLVEQFDDDRGSATLWVQVLGKLLVSYQIVAGQKVGEDSSYDGDRIAAVDAVAQAGSSVHEFLLQRWPWIQEIAIFIPTGKSSLCLSIRA